jgi:outer membrane protein assembly factor BamD (BamD/ComL family)
VKENPAGFERFGAQWTPTIIVTDPVGNERYRFEGYLPADEFMAQLQLGLAKVAFTKNNFGKAEQLYREIVERFPNSAAAPEALYWAGVSKYKGTNYPGALKDTAEAFRSRYVDSQWAKKASVWAG